MKRFILQKFGEADLGSQRVIVKRTLDKMDWTLSRPVLQKIAAYRDEGWCTVLATAAPECYARPFSEAFGFDDCIASPPVLGDEPWEEMIGLRKAESCKAWADAIALDGIAEFAAITDHPDDLPLLRLASRVVIQAPPKDADWLVGHLSCATDVFQIDPIGGCGDRGGMWLWIDDRPAGPCDVWEVRTLLSKHRYALLYRRDFRWERALPGDSLDDAAIRIDCPRPPTAMARVSIAARRRIVRDFLGIFH